VNSLQLCYTYDKKLTTLTTPIHAYSNYLWEKVILSYQKEKEMKVNLDFN